MVTPQKSPRPQYAQSDRENQLTSVDFVDGPVILSCTTAPAPIEVGLRLPYKQVVAQEVVRYHSSLTTNIADQTKVTGKFLNGVCSPRRVRNFRRTWYRHESHD